VSEKCEDGIWLFKGTDGYTRVRFVKDGRGSITLSEGGLRAPSPFGGFPWTPIRRIADLDGRPVVSEAAINAIADDQEVEQNAEPQQANDEIAVLKARIAELEKQRTNIYRENATGDEWLFLPEDRKSFNRMGYRLRDGHTEWFSRSEISSYFTPLPDPAERPTTEGDGLSEFLRKLGVFPCWDDVGIKRSAWKCPGGYGVLFEDGSVWNYTAEFFDRFFTRTPPHPLSPELESLVKPLAEKLGKTETEVRGAILEAQGAGICQS
jgi:hypothetical protein